MNRNECHGWLRAARGLAAACMLATPAIAAFADSDADDANLESVERTLIVRMLRAANWNQSQAAKRLGITRKMLMSRIAKFGIEREPH